VREISDKCALTLRSGILGLIKLECKIYANKIKRTTPYIAEYYKLTAQLERGGRHP